MKYITVFIPILALVACTASPQTLPASTPTQTSFPIITFTPIATIALPTSTPMPTITPSATHTPTPTTTLTPTTQPSNTPQPSPTLLPSSSPTPPPARTEHYWLRRPIERNEQLVDWLDRTYPYGSTQQGLRDVHLGVEFVNARFTPVLASADGVVIFAGDDSQTLIGPQLNYYGNVIIIEHTRLASSTPVFTLYAHLQEYRVAQGDRVLEGQVIGRVGDTGIAIGPHLHFEVRLSDAFDYTQTRNPDLWIRPYPQFGTLAGNITHADGSPVYELLILLRSVNINRETYTYARGHINPSQSWQENFTHGDLPVGDYELIVTEPNGRIRHRQDFTIQNGITTFLEISLPPGG